MDFGFSDSISAVMQYVSPCRRSKRSGALRTLLTRVAVALLLSLSLSSHSSAESTAPGKSDELLASLARITVSPVNLTDGSKLTLISPERWSTLSTKVIEGLQETHNELSARFGLIPPFTSSVRLQDQDTFLRNTGAPKWTNALFYRGQILIPLSVTEDPDEENLVRSVRHEYTHAVINALSAGRCPGWLDEGIAQWIEGTENPALKPALYGWLRDNPPVPLNLLQGGFTKLDTAMVPAAYAQSLFSSTVMINTFGFKPLRTYLDGLRNGMDKDEAFRVGFGISTETFERRLQKTLGHWLKKQGRADLRGAT